TEETHHFIHEHEEKAESFMIFIWSIIGFAARTYTSTQAKLNVTILTVSIDAVFLGLLYY
ncbi:MAG: hypothetical protein ACPGSN_01165, partial [Psychrobium sp.]